MRKYLIIMLATLSCAACNNTTTREFRASDNHIVAICQYEGTDSLNATWQFLDQKGEPYYPDCDSLRVVEIGPEGHPMTVCFYLSYAPNGVSELWQQFYPNMQTRSHGNIVNGLREGTWTFYFPNGTPRSRRRSLQGFPREWSTLLHRPISPGTAHRHVGNLQPRRHPGHHSGILNTEHQ